uniref:DDE-1 domain-containing protein n=1 Tax=Timema douglasi TaxID=61478 RepID=A0A7R8VYI2_TIMDO|nr:unnamed protein product [Timema douglasi]
MEPSTVFTDAAPWAVAAYSPHRHAGMVQRLIQPTEMNEAEMTAGLLVLYWERKEGNPTSIRLGVDNMTTSHGLPTVLRMTPTSRRNMSIRPSILNQACQIDQDCKVHLNNSMCDQSHKVCDCAPGFIESSYTQECLQGAADRTQNDGQPPTPCQCGALSGALHSTFRPVPSWHCSEFKDRHNLSIKRPQSVEMATKKACDPFGIQEYDETSFSTDPSKTKVVGLRGSPCTRLTSSSGKDNIIVLFAGNAAGAVGDERRVILFYDGHSTHVGLQLIEIARKENIAIVKLPPHSSYLLQPLDLCVFKSLKTEWDAALVRWQRQHGVVKLLTTKDGCKDSNQCLHFDNTLCQNGSCQCQSNYHFDKLMESLKAWFLALPEKHREEVTMYRFSWGVLFSAAPLPTAWGVIN